MATRTILTQLPLSTMHMVPSLSTLDSTHILDLAPTPLGSADFDLFGLHVEDLDQEHKASFEEITLDFEQQHRDSLDVLAQNPFLLQLDEGEGYASAFTPAVVKRSVVKRASTSHDTAIVKMEHAAKYQSASSTPIRQVQKIQNAGHASPKTKKSRNNPGRKPKRILKDEHSTSKRKRSRMPEAEQKRRNCESAKRSRLKKMKELEEAKAKVDRMELELQCWKKKWTQMKELGCDLAFHWASNPNCQCAALCRSKLKKLLEPPVFK